MKSIRLLPLIIMLISLAACQSSQEKLNRQISSLQDRLFESEQGFSRSGADSLVNLYIDYASDYPQDTLAPVYLFNAATITMNMGNGEQALELFARIMNDYPGYVKTPLCLFFTGYVQENLFADIDKARQSYTLFIEKYPDHDFADDAQASIRNLGKTPEEMIMEFESMQEN